MPTTKTQALIWVLTLIITARLVYSAVQHHLPFFDIAAIATLASYGFRAGFESIATSVRRARTETRR